MFEGALLSPQAQYSPPFSYTIEYAGVVELADTYDLGSYVVRHAGSSPVARTTASSHNGFRCGYSFFKSVMNTRTIQKEEPKLLFYFLVNFIKAL